MGPRPTMVEEWDGDPDDVFDCFEVVDLPADHLAKRHFGFGQNDADVLALEVGSDFVELTLCHYDVRRLACEFGGLYNWEALKQAFPVTFRFEGVTELVVLRQVEQGAFQKIRCSQRSRARALLDVRRMECIHFEPELQRYCIAVHLRWDADFHRSGQLIHRQWPELYVLVESRRLSVVEGHREGWQRLYGEQNLGVLEAFDAVWPVTSWSAKDFAKWLAEYKRQRSASTQ